MSVRTVSIDAADDPRIEAFRDIRERDLTGRGGFIAEGAVVLDQLLRSRDFRPTSLLILKNRLGGLQDRLSRLDPEIPVYVTERAVFDAIAGFPVHRGVLAHGERRASCASPDLREMAKAGALVVVAVGIANHDNMGAIFRNAAAFGADAVLLDESACDPLYRKAIRVSVGSALTVPFARFGAAEDLVAELQEAGFTCAALSPHGQTPLSGWRARGPTALVLGTEGDGLPQAVRTKIEGVRIEMVESLDSLNVATAAAITLHHVYASRRSVG